MYKRQAFIIRTNVLYLDSNSSSVSIAPLTLPLYVSGFLALAEAISSRYLSSRASRSILATLASTSVIILNIEFYHQQVNRLLFLKV